MIFIDFFRNMRIGPMHAQETKFFQFHDSIFIEFLEIQGQNTNMRIIEKGINPDSEIFLYHRTLHSPNPFFRLISIAHYKASSLYAVSEFAVDGFVLLLIVKGDGYITQHNATTYIHTGQMLLLSGYDRPSFGTNRGIEYYSIVFTGITQKEFFNNLRMKSLCVEIKDVLPSFLALLTPFQEGRQPEEELVNHQLATLIEYFSSNGNDRKFDEVYDYICTHLGERIAVEDLAKMVGLSTFYFIRAFNEDCGMTPHEFLIKYRVYAASYLLRASSMTLGEITKCCGFSNESAFNNTFKKIKGITPMMYRKSAKKPIQMEQ